MFGTLANSNPRVERCTPKQNKATNAKHKKLAGYCHLRNDAIRCARDPNQLPAVRPGGITAMFERILEEFQELKPVVHSRPPDGPWLMTIDNFITDEEAARFIHYGGDKFKRSVDAGAMKDDGSAEFEHVVSAARTSSTFWCTGLVSLLFFPLLAARV